MRRGIFIFFLTIAVVILLGWLIWGMDEVEFAPDKEITPGLKNWQKAQWLREQGKYEESIKILEEEIHNKSYDNKILEKAICWQNISLDYWNLGEVDKAQSGFAYVLALLKERPNEPLREYATTAIEVIELYKEAKAKRQQQKYKESEQLFLKAIQISQKNGMKELELKLQRQLSIIYWNKHELDLYLNANKISLNLAESINNYYDQIMTLNNIVLFYLKKRRFSIAISLSERGIRLAEKYNYSDKLPEVYLNRAIIYYYIGNYDLSEYYIDKATKIYEKNGDLPSIVSSYVEISLLIYKKEISLQKDEVSKRKIDLLNIALELSRKCANREQEAAILCNLGLFLMNDDLSKAEKILKEAIDIGLEINNKEAVAAALNNLGTIYLRRNQTLEAMKNYQQSLSLALKIDYWPEIWNDYAGLGQCYEKMGKYEMALNSYEKALETIDKIRETIDLDFNKVSFNREKKSVYEGIIRCLVLLKEEGKVEKNIDEEIFSFMRKVKAIAFQEGLVEISDVEQNKDLADELSRTDQQISKIIADYENDHNEEFSNRLLELEYRYLQILEEENNTRKNGEDKFTNNLSLYRFQKEALSDDQVLLDYYLGEKESYCFLIGQDTYQIIKLPSEKEIENSIKLYIKLLSDSSIDAEDLYSAGYKIGTMLIPPLKNLPMQITSLSIIPDGLLNYLPFETLVFEDQKDKGRRKYLVEDFSISYAPSITAFYKFKKMLPLNNYKKELLVFGNPYYDSSEQKRVRSLTFFLNGQPSAEGFKLPPLPYSQQEAKEISRLFSRSKADLFLKKKATEENLKALWLRDYRILHFACHGLISENYPQRSCLVLSLLPGTREDGFLTVREIYNLKLKAELVVLSACETSRGALEKVEGIIGLPRVFLLSGSRAVVSSLWSVNDRATQKFMKDFYSFLLNGDAKDEALRKAKIKMIKSGRSHPYYWAAFVLIGNSDKIY